MTRAAFWHTLLQLGTTALPVLAGLLAGCYLRQRHLDQAEHDAWDDGFTEGLHVAMHACLCDDCHTSLDEVASQLTAAQKQATPSDEPWWN